jgi:hypothetical protein
MSVENEAAWLWAAKCAGAVAGSAVSLAYMLPSGRHEAAARFVTGVTCGLVFGSTAGLKIAKELQIGGLLGPTEIMLMGSAAASLCAWWALGLLRHLMRATPRSQKHEGGGERG